MNGEFINSGFNKASKIKKELATALDEEEQPTIYLYWSKPPKLSKDEARKKAEENLKIHRHIATYGLGSVQFKWGGMYMEDGTLVKPDGSLDESKKQKKVSKLLSKKARRRLKPA